MVEARQEVPPSPDDAELADEPTVRVSMLRTTVTNSKAMSCADQNLVLQAAAFEMELFCTRYARVTKLDPIFDAVRQVELVEPWFRLEPRAGRRED